MTNNLSSFKKLEGRGQWWKSLTTTTERLFLMAKEMAKDSCESIRKWQKAQWTLVAHQDSMIKFSSFLKSAVCKCCMWVVTRHAIFNSPILVVNTHMDTDGTENSISLIFPGYLLLLHCLCTSFLPFSLTSRSQLSQAGLLPSFPDFLHLGTKSSCALRKASLKICQLCSSAWSLRAVSQEGPID